MDFDFVFHGTAHGDGWAAADLDRGMGPRSLAEQPPLDALMDGEEFVAFLQVPGLAEPPIIYAGPDRLVIEGVQDPDAGDRSPARATGPRSRAFAREIALPPGVDPDRLQLDYLAGVLRICIPPRSARKAA